MYLRPKLKPYQDKKAVKIDGAFRKEFLPLLLPRRCMYNIYWCILYHIELSREKMMYGRKRAFFGVEKTLLLSSGLKFIPRFLFSSPNSKGASYYYYYWVVVDFLWWEGEKAHIAASKVVLTTIWWATRRWCMCGLFIISFIFRLLQTLFQPTQYRKQ